MDPELEQQRIRKSQPVVQPPSQVGKTTRVDETPDPGAANGPYRGTLFGPQSVTNLEGEKKRERTEVEDWNVKGKEISNEDPETKSKRKKQKGAGVNEADLSTVPQNEGSWNNGETGTYYDSRSGSGSTPEDERNGPKAKTDGKSGIVSMRKVDAAVGEREKIGVRGRAETSDQFGTTSATGDLNATAEYGASGGYKVGSNQAELYGSASAKAVLNANGEVRFDTTVQPLAGDPMKLGFGARGDVNVGVEVGLGGRAGVGTEFTGVDLNAGGMIGGEGTIDINANAGPVSGKVTGSGIIGAAANADAAVYYQNGKVRVRGGAKLAWGWGAGVKVDVELDLAQAVYRGIVTAQYAKDLLDGDQDKVITINDPATHVANGMVNTAETVDKGVKNALSTADGNQDGTLGVDDAKVHVNNFVDKTVQTKDAIVDKAIQKKDAIVDTAKRVHDTLDYDNDGAVAPGDATKFIGDSAVATIEKGKQIARDVGDAVEKAKTLVQDTITDAGDFDDDGELGGGDLIALVEDAVKTVEDTTDAITEKAKSVAIDVHDALDVDKSGGLGVNDAVTGVKNAKDAVVDKTIKTKDAVVDKTIKTKDAVVEKTIAAKDKVVATYNNVIETGVRAIETTKKRIVQTRDVVRKGLDRDGDGNVDLVRDGRAGLQQGKERAKQFAATQRQRARRVIYKYGDRNRDGHVDNRDLVAAKDQVIAKAKRMKNTFVGGVREIYSSVSARVQQAGQTLSNGWEQARTTVTGTLNTLWSYRPWR